MSITLKFPRNKEVKLEQGKPVVILGANGAGKTRFGIKIEELNDARYSSSATSEEAVLIHRLSAQKSLSIQETLMITDYDSSSRDLFYGGSSQHATKQGYRYSSSPATVLLDDFNKALAYLFAEENKELQEAHEADRQAEQAGQVRPRIITTVRETATNIWNELLPARRIDLTGNGVHAIFNDIKYHGKEMSDGERVMLYMICQALLVKKNSVLIIDEPELHIHKAVVKKLWNRLEAERQDCVFVYITHDLDFAASRNTGKVLWIKGFDGTEWDYEWLTFSDYADLPQELLYELLGTKKKVLFVEGNRNSFDHKLYSAFFRNSDLHIVPCGGCSEVIQVYKAKKTYEKLGSVEAYCLIDRDYRTDEEIAALEQDGVKFLNVAEIENLFVVPAVMKIMERQLGCPEGTAKAAEDSIVDLFEKLKSMQVKAAFLKEVNHQLTLHNYNSSSDKNITVEEIQADITAYFSIEAIREYLTAKKKIYDDAKTLDDILSIFNYKSLSAKVSSIFCLTASSYPEKVINILKTESDARNQIVEALKPYIPRMVEE